MSAASELVERLNRFLRWYGHHQAVADAIDELERLEKQNIWLTECREGDFELTRALAKDAGISITADNKLPGAQWEQFHRGVMRLAALKAQAPAAEWVKLSTRKPTEDDAREAGMILVLTVNRDQDCSHWSLSASDDRFVTHWMRLPAPPAPEESAAQKQEREDEAAYQDSKTCVKWTPDLEKNFRLLWKHALAHARQNGGSHE
jgi:hypothetical protein